MERIVHFIFLFSVLCFLSSCDPRHKYLLVNTPKSWPAAQSYCRETCLDLATIEDLAENRAALEAVQDYENPVWIGCRQGTTPRWHWALADKDFYKEGERDYLIWARDPGGGCVTFKNGKLDTLFCLSKQRFICFDAKQQGREQYVLPEEKRNWVGSQTYCRTFHTDLVSVRNEEESRIIQEVASGLKVWVGLFLDTWEWSDQTNSSFRYWESAIGSKGEVEKCAYVAKKRNGIWKEKPCDTEYPFLCNCPVVSFIRVRISSYSLDPNVTAAQDQILNHMEEKLNNTKVTKVLGWKKLPNGKLFIKDPN